MRSDSASKRARLDEDLAEDTVAEVVATITQPKQMAAPEVLFSENAARDEAAKVIILLWLLDQENFH